MTSDPWDWTETFSRTDRPRRDAADRDIEDDYVVIPPASEPATTGRVVLRREPPFPLAERRPEPVFVTSPCGCSSMITEPGDRPVQVSWCTDHDPGYEPPGGKS